MIKIKHYLADVILLTIFQLKSTYNRSMAGSIWVIIKPLMNTLTFAFVMSRLATLPIDQFFSFIAINLTTWGFITTSVITSITIFSANRNILINRNVDPKKIILTAVFKALYIYLLSMILPIAVGIIIGNVKIGFVVLAFIPYLAILIYILFCVCFVFACIFPYAEDIAYIVELGIPIAMWLTPVIYPIEKIPGILASVQVINPLYILINPFTNIFHKNTLPSFTDNMSLFVVALLSTIAYLLAYKKLYRNIIYRLSGQ